METNAGRAALTENPDNQGSLGLAISEAVEDAASRADTNYALGSGKLEDFAYPEEAIKASLAELPKVG